MTSEGLGEMFEGDSADMCAGKFSLTSMGGRAEGLACADQGARTPIGVSGNFTPCCLIIRTAVTSRHEETCKQASNACRYLLEKLWCKYTQYYTFKTK